MSQTIQHLPRHTHGHTMTLSCRAIQMMMRVMPLWSFINLYLCQDCSDDWWLLMLRRAWKQKQGVKATYKQLQEMFEECKRADLVEVIEQLVAGLSEESEATVNVESFFMQACMYNCIKIVSCVVHH